MSGDRARVSEIEVGRVRVWEPPWHLKFTGSSANFAPQEQTEVEIQFEPTASGTLVTVTHSGFAALRADHPARHGLQRRRILANDRSLVG